MRRSLPESLLSRTVNHILIRNKTKLEALYAQNLVEVAQKEARKIIKEAQKQSEYEKQSGYAHGYYNGLAAALNAIVSFINDYQQVCQSVWDDELVKLQDRLYSFITTPDVCEGLLKQMLSQCPEKSILQLTIPPSLVSLAKQISAEHHQEIELITTQNALLSVRFKNQVIFFDPLRYSHELTDLLKHGRHMQYKNQQLETLDSEIRKALYLVIDNITVPSQVNNHENLDEPTTSNTENN